MRRQKTSPLIILSVLAALSSNVTGCAKTEPVVKEGAYKIDRIGEGLKLTLSLPGDEDGQTKFKVGESWADEKKPHTRFKNIKSEPYEMTQDDGTLTIKHPAGADLEITWELHSEDRRKDPAFLFAPVITDEYVHLIGYTSLITPTGNAPMQVTFGGAALEEAEGTVLSPLWQGKDVIDADAINSGFALSGNIDTAISADGHVSVGVAEGADISAADFVDNLNPILTSLSEVWGTPTVDYSVTLQPEDPTKGAVLVGTAFPGGYAAAATPNADIDKQLLGGFFTHEAAHEFIPYRLGALEFEGGDREPEGYWISEGFTQFLSRAALLQAKSIDTDGYAALVNEDLRELYTLPNREFTNAQIGEKFWTNHKVGRLPYLRGFLLAAKWDHEIDTASEGARGMIDVLKAIEITNKKTPGGIMLTSEIVVEHVRNMGAKNPRKDVVTFIDDGRLFEPSPDMLGDSFSLVELEITPYDVGFDPDNTQQTLIVEGVKKQSAAYKAGLRDGMKFISVLSGGSGDTSVPLVLQVEDEGRPTEISYMPLSENKVKLPEFRKND